MAGVAVKTTRVGIVPSITRGMASTEVRIRAITATAIATRTNRSSARGLSPATTTATAGMLAPEAATRIHRTPTDATVLQRRKSASATATSKVSTTRTTANASIRFAPRGTVRAITNTTADTAHANSTSANTARPFRADTTRAIGASAGRQREYGNGDSRRVQRGPGLRSDA